MSVTQLHGPATRRRVIRSLDEVVAVALADMNDNATIDDVVEVLRDTATAREWWVRCEQMILDEVGSVLAEGGGRHDAR